MAMPLVKKRVTSTKIQKQIHTRQKKKLETLKFLHIHSFTHHPLPFTLTTRTTNTKLHSIKSSSPIIITHNTTTITTTFKHEC